MGAWRRIATAGLVLGVLAAGCGGGGGSGTAATRSKAADPLGAEALRMARLTGGARDRAVAKVAGELWDGLLEETGVGEALGPDGLEQLDDVFADIAEQSKELDAIAGSTTGGFTPPGGVARGKAFAPRAAGRTADGTLPSVSALQVAYYEVIAAGKAVVQGSNNGGTGQKTLDDGEVVLTAEPGSASFESHRDQSVSGARFHLDDKVKIAPCPDANGRFEASGRVDARLEAASGAAGGRAEIDYTVKGRIDDDAHLVDVDTDLRVQMSDYVTGKTGAFLDVTAGFHSSGFDGELPTAMTSTGGNVNRAAGKMLTKDLAESYASAGELFAQMAALDAVKAAKGGWESGRCVELRVTPDGAHGLKPSATVTVKAEPRSKIDGRATGGTVRATLSAGKESVDPEGKKVRAPATFTYEAPGERDQSGDVDLEARSRRGVGMASPHFDTRTGRYRASGGGNGLSVSGSGIDVRGEYFVIKGTFPGGGATFRYTPTSTSGGTVTYSGGGSGAQVSGKGTYTISGEEGGPLTLTQTVSGCASMGGCRTTTDVITLTPED